MSPAAMLHDFRSLAPPYRGEQQRAVEWLASAHAQSEIAAHPGSSPSEEAERAHRLRRRVRRYGSASQRVRTRHSVVEDFLHTDWDAMRIYRLRDAPAGVSCAERMRLFGEIVDAAFERLYSEEDQGPDVLLHVTCTGYVAPSGAQRLVAHRKWGDRTEVVHLYHMGCYASLPGIRLAAGLLASEKQRVDLVHTELCTLHLDPSDHGAEQLIAQALFADGMIRYSVAAGEPQGRGPGLAVCGTREEILPDTGGEMAWVPSEHGMRISLSRAVPEKIAPALAPFLGRLAQAAKLDAQALRERAVFAVHPGGPRIVDGVGAALGLRDEQLAASNAVLEACGNMSSATLPTIWQAILDDDDVSPGTPVVSLAFGPGLTISGAVLRKEA